MRLLYLVPEFPSQTHAFFWREMQGLRSLGVDVVPVSTRRPAPDACRHDFAQVATEQTHYLFPPEWVRDVFFLLTKPVGGLKALTYIADLEESTWLERLKASLLILPAARLARLSQKLGAQHLHVHSFANSAHVAALATRLGGCPYSLTLHGDLAVYGKDHASKAKHARFVTCVTAALKRQLMDRLGIPSDKVHLIWMGVDTLQFTPGGRPLRDRSAPLRLLSVARLHYNKGHRFALRALKRHQEEGLNACYTIVGEGPCRDEIAQEIVSLGLSESVHLVGTRSESEVLQLLQASDALLLTSVSVGEAAPVAVMEAMACGLPVVCSIIGGTPDMIDHAKDGFLVEQEDVNAIAGHLRQLNEQPETAFQMGQAARIRAIKDFDSRTLASALLRLIAAPHTPSV